MHCGFGIVHILYAYALGSGVRDGHSSAKLTASETTEYMLY